MRVSIALPAMSGAELRQQLLCDVFYVSLQARCLNFSFAEPAVLEATKTYERLLQLCVFDITDTLQLQDETERAYARQQALLEELDQQELAANERKSAKQKKKKLQKERRRRVEHTTEQPEGEEVGSVPPIAYHTANDLFDVDDRELSLDELIGRAELSVLKRATA